MSKVSTSAIGLISSLETRLVMRKLLIGAAIGLCVGALAGGLGFLALASDSTATAFLRLQNPADLAAIAGGASQITPDNQGNSGTFVAGEIAYLSGEGFAQAVARKMAEDQPAVLNVAQANQSSVVTISCSSRSDDEATRTVQTAIDLYSQELAQRSDEQLRQIMPTLSQWQQRDTVDANRVQEIQRARESVELQAAQARTLLVVQPPTPNHSSSEQWLIGAILGGLVGASCVVGVLLTRRRRSGRGALVTTLTENIDGVLLPAVDLDTPPDGRARLARTLYAQCPYAGPDRVILVIDASSSSGGFEVASLLESAAAEVEPATRVLSGGVVDDETLTRDVIGGATDIVLVARLESDTMEQALKLRSAVASSAASVVAAFTYRRRRGEGRTSA